MLRDGDPLSAADAYHIAVVAINHNKHGVAVQYYAGRTTVWRECAAQINDPDIGCTCQQ
jgi:hypothetical protein